MELPRAHFLETKRLISKINKDKIADWLLQEGYFAEQYVLPPPFKVVNFNLQSKPYHPVIKSWRPTLAELVNLSYPKSSLTDRTFGVMEPTLYHDIVWHLHNNWTDVKKHLYHNDIKIYSYSFPIPVTSKSETEIGSLRTGRMIYEFLEMAEKDLVAEAHNYTYLLQTDIKNCYPSIYTHSIAWALHGKDKARNDRYTYSLLGNKLDKLFQNVNDGCTNGIPIGSALSDLIVEIILSRVDRETSKQLTRQGIKFLGVRYKDDYRFLCENKGDAEAIIKILQSKLRSFNLTLSEDKSDIKPLPEGLFRNWTAFYQPYSLKYKSTITYKRFENSLLGVLNIDKQFPNTGVIDKFLSELYDNDCVLKLKISEDEVLKVFSLLLLLKKRRSKAFPQVLAIIEDLYAIFRTNRKLVAKMTAALQQKINEGVRNIDDNLYDLIWLTYFGKSNKGFMLRYPRGKKPLVLQSLISNDQKFFNTNPNIQLYTSIRRVLKTPLAEHLLIFNDCKQ